MCRTHVIPVADNEPHYGQSTCWCFPLESTIQPTLFIHNAKDCREVYERLTGRKFIDGWMFVYEEVSLSNQAETKTEKSREGEVCIISHRPWAKEPLGAYRREG